MSRTTTGQNNGAALDALSSIDCSMPPGVDEVIELYRRRQQQLRFPGVDAVELSAAAERLVTASCEVVNSRTQLDAALRAEAGAEAQLLGACKRAFAYAQLFAEDDPTLKAELSTFRFAKPEKGRPKAEGGTPKERRPKRLPSTAPSASQEPSLPELAPEEPAPEPRLASGTRRRA